MYLKPIKYKEVNQIAKEWDFISTQRDILIKSGKDISFSEVIVPCILNQIRNCEMELVVDGGCGTGVLSSLISDKATNVVGIDISSISIEIAKKNYADKNNLTFYNISIEEYAHTNPDCVTLCVANMVLMNILELDFTIKSINRMLKDDGFLIFSVIHPCFWPIYWDYFNEPWFDYNKEIVIESEFSTTLCNNMGISTHVHRPLNRYIDVLHSNGFQVLECQEPYPQTIHDNYKYSYPRFLCIKCKKQ